MYSVHFLMFLGQRLHFFCRNVVSAAKSLGAEFWDFLRQKLQRFSVLDKIKTAAKGVGKKLGKTSVYW